jgi:hypothetical protein
MPERIEWVFGLLERLERAKRTGTPADQLPA